MSFADSQFLIVIKADRSSRAAHAHALFRAGRHRSSPPPLSRHAFSPASPDRFVRLPLLLFARASCAAWRLGYSGLPGLDRWCRLAEIVLGEIRLCSEAEGAGGDPNQSGGTRR
jgi:hypothetical protein